MLDGNSLFGDCYSKDVSFHYTNIDPEVLKLTKIKSRDCVLGQIDANLPWQEYSDPIREMDIEV
jgi:hypothetical protein